MNKKYIPQINRFFNSNLKCFKNSNQNPDLKNLRVKERFFQPAILSSCWAIWIGRLLCPWPEISTVEVNLIPKWFPKKTPTNIPSISKKNKKKYSFIASNCLLIRVSCVCFHSGYVGKIYGVFPKVCLFNGQA